MSITIGKRKQAIAEMLITNCKLWDECEGTQYPDSTFEDGVQVALFWLMGYTPDPPEVDPPNSEMDCEVSP